MMVPEGPGELARRWMGWFVWVPEPPHEPSLPSFVLEMQMISSSQQEGSEETWLTEV